MRWGKNGEFVGCSAYPKCGFTGDFSRDAQGRYPGAPVAAGRRGRGASRGPEARGKPGPTGLTCPKCGKDLLVRRGRLGEFLGCSGYPKCRFTQNFTRDAQRQAGPRGAGKPDGGAYPAPGKAAAARLVKRRSRRGIFYGCSNYPKCAFTMNQPPHGDRPAPNAISPGS